MNELLEFVGDLRAAGLVIGTDRIVSAARALAILPSEPYWPLRTTLCTRPEDLVVFDEVWLTRRPAGGTRPEAVSGTVATAARDDATGTTADAVSDDEPTGAGSRADLTRRDVRDLTDAELDEIRRLITLLTPATRRRPTMRRRPHRTGRIDPPRTVRLMMRNGGEPGRIARNRRSWRPRRLLLLVDVSESMAAYSDTLLRFAHAAVTAAPGTTEVFAVGTRWTRLTDPLRRRDADAAMRAVAAVESAWKGGTTLGPVLHEFLRGWGGRTAVRSAVIVLGSDGMEFGDLGELPRQVALLARLGHALIWVNPARAIPGYVPLNPALVDSLPHATHELTGHNFDALRQLAEVIAR